MKIQGLSIRDKAWGVDKILTRSVLFKDYKYVHVTSNLKTTIENNFIYALKLSAI